MSASSILIGVSQFGGYEPDPMKKLQRLHQAIPNPHGRRLTAEEVIALAEPCVGIIAGLEPLDRSVLSVLPNLRCISRVGVGVDIIDLSYAAERNIKVCVTPEAPTQAVAELAIGMIFDLLRSISLSDRTLRGGEWKRIQASQLAGKMVGVIGLGRIGRRISEMLQALQARVIGADPTPDQSWCETRKIPVMPLKNLLAQSDIVTLHLSTAPGNSHLLGTQELASMKKGAYLVNLSRGGVIDEAALYQALRSGHLKGAAIDVFAKEPYQGPLATLDQVILTPHIGSFTQESRALMEHEAVDNLLKYLELSHAGAR
jgi:D-3-phosphoglycerate dehydrogenase